ncbi:MAG TPA: hypothetical protein VJ868_05225 [Actinomycetota bacterium]|nr:hypothetical protein [Actinomycetota bacterium]
MSQLSRAGAGGGPGRASRMLRGDSSGLRFRGSRSPYLFLAIPFLVGAILAAIITWLVVKPGPGDPAVVEYVAAQATVDRKARQLTVLDESGQPLGRLEVTKLTEGRRCLRRAEGRIDIVAGIINIEPDDTVAEPRNLLLSVECRGTAG